MDLKEKTLNSQDIYSGRIITVRVDTVELPDGRTGTREIVEHAGAVGIIPIDDQGNVWMVRQYRKPVEQVLLEIPAGTMEAGEEPLACAQRELEEETGFIAEQWEKIIGYYSAPGFCNEYLHLYIATKLYRGVANPDQDEFLEKTYLPLEEAYQGIFRGQIVDGKSIIALQYAYQRYIQS